jgi:CO dehydrogenase maturation factor
VLFLHRFWYNFQWNSREATHFRASAVSLSGLNVPPDRPAVGPEGNEAAGAGLEIDMKLLICGKGGSGKSTLSVLLSRAFADHGDSVLLIDADESNLGLGRLAGVDHTQTLLDYLGGKQGLKARQGAGWPGDDCTLFYQAPFDLSDIPNGCIASAEGVRLLKIGKIQRFEEGCACPMGGMMRQLLTHIRLADRERVVIDTAAGIEHFGRGIERHCDRIIGVIDPTFESFKLAKTMDRLAADAGIEMGFVLNKADERAREAMAGFIAPERIIGDIPMSDALFSASLEGTPLDHRMTAVDDLRRRLIREARPAPVESHP